MIFSQQQLLPALQTLLQTNKDSIFVCNSFQSSSSISNLVYQIYRVNKPIQEKCKSRIILMHNYQTLTYSQKEYQQYFGVKLLLLGGADLPNQNKQDKYQSSDNQNLTEQKSISIQALPKTNEDNTGLITFDIGTNIQNLQITNIYQISQTQENQLKVFLNKKDAAFITTLDRLIQVYDQSYQNQHQSRKFNDISLRFINPSQLKFLAQQLKEGKIQSDQSSNTQLSDLNTQLLDLIRSVQIVGNQETLEQLRAEQQNSQNQLTDHSNDTVLQDAFVQILYFQPEYLRSKEGAPSTIKFFKDNIVLLENISRGGQGEVRVGFNQKTKQVLAIKHFLTSKGDYKRERDMYKHLAQNECSDLILKLLESDDENKILVMERGICDLKTFAELRRETGHQDGPITALEILLIMDYVAITMQRLLKSANTFLCDIKEENILIQYYDQGFGGYKPILTDLGSAYCKQLDKYATYPVAYTRNYFNPAVLQNLERDKQLKQTTEDEKQIIKSEIYTLARMIQSLLSYCLPQKEDENFNILRELFQGHNQIQEYFQLFEQSILKFNENQGYREIAELIKNILTDQGYDNYQILSDQINQTKLQVQQISKVQKAQVEFLSDSSGSTKKWQQNLITRKSDFSLLTLDELKQQSEFYYEYELFTQSISVNQKLLERLQVELQKLKSNQADGNQVQINEIMMLFCQTFKYLGNALMQTGNEQKSLECHEMELELRKSLQEEDENNDEIAECYYYIGRNNIELGDIERAHSCFQNSLKIKKQIFGEDDINLCGTYKCIGNVYSDQGDLQQALEMYMRCLIIEKAYYGDNNFNLASTYGNIGNVYREGGNLEQALGMYMKCLNIMKARYGDNNFHLATIYGNIGKVFREQGNLEQALEMQMKCINLKKAHYGDNNFNLANTYECIGIVYTDQGNLEQGLEMYMRSLNIKKAHYGDNNFNLATTYGNIGSIYLQQENLEQALDMYMKCLQIEKAHYGDDNYNLATSYYNLSLLLKSMKDLGEAFQMAKKSYQIFKNHYGEHHQHTQMAKWQCDEIQSMM